MTTLVRTEFRKLLTTRLWWAMLIGSLALTALATSATILTDGVEGNPTPPLTDPVTQRTLFGSSGIAGIFILIIGIIAVTSEYRHFTSRPTFLFEPRRQRVVVAKLLAGAGMGLVYSVLCAALATAIILPWLSAKDIDVSIVDNGILTTLIATVAMVAIFAVVGVGIGILIRNQIVAVVVTLAYVFVVEPLLGVIPGVKEAYPYLIGGATDAMTQATVDPNPDLLQPWPATAVFIGWGLVFAALGSWLSVRRDVP